MGSARHHACLANDFVPSPLKRRQGLTRAQVVTTSRVRSALERWLRRDVPRAWPGIFSSCFHMSGKISFLSFLQVPRLVKVVLETSPYFKLTSPGGVCCKVAPGMCSTFQIQFTPEENKDYFYQLTCITEREKFIVPIRAIGARAILDFPDQLNFSVCPVKYSSQKTLLVRNIGNREARYRISTESPFSVDPSIGTLGIGDAMQVTVEFHPLKTGDHSSSLVVRYDTEQSPF
ncbi:hydrocephalus-inducing protein homolog [Strix uralensis]|uniref:hydrocephalus-inducing protein homolog n=1 Tax=Strix uralensis TaxID=36305 RepID=UPI003DA72192